MFKINSKENYLVACSGGPDSMALLDMARKNCKHIEVAHVNYHKRDTAKRDENIVRKYCKKYKLKLHVLNVHPEDVKGNFQAYAREARYSYFNKICTKNELDAVLVAHHKDDLIETYFMQMDKKLKVSCYGLASEILINDVFVIRPLLDYTKADLVKYCEDNHIEYGIDESNNSDCYTRNKIRHSKVDKMSKAEKNKVVAEINKKNKEEDKKYRIGNKIFGKKSVFTVKEFVNAPYVEYGLRTLLGDKSDKFFDEMLRQIKTAKSYCYKGDLIWVSKEYDKVHVFFRPLKYYFKFKNMDELLKCNYYYFKVGKRGASTDTVTLAKKDFPVYLRMPLPGDKITLRYGTKKLNRFFIDNKVPTKDRLTWPVLENKNGEVILVPGIGCDVAHYSQKPNVSVIKLNWSEE